MYFCLKHISLYPFVLVFVVYTNIWNYKSIYVCLSIVPTLHTAATSTNSKTIIPKAAIEYTHLCWGLLWGYYLWEFTAALVAYRTVIIIVHDVTRNWSVHFYNFYAHTCKIVQTESGGSIGDNQRRRSADREETSKAPPAAARSSPPPCRHYSPGQPNHQLNRLLIVN